MASHTFVWPTQEYEYREMGYTLLQVTVAMSGRRRRGGGPGPVLPVDAAVQPADPQARALDRRRTRRPDGQAFDGGLRVARVPDRRDADARPLRLRPTGKARFGDLLIDVTADGFFIEPDSLVEVVDVQGTE